MFAHERSLVEKYQGRPFALLGVDQDGKRETLQKAEKKNDLNWRSWWDDGRSIAGQWDVEVLPTLFLIDHKGVVRWRCEGVPNLKQMDELIVKWVKEAENESGKQASLRRR